MTLMVDHRCPFRCAGRCPGQGSVDPSRDRRKYRDVLDVLVCVLNDAGYPISREKLQAALQRTKHERGYH